MLHAVNMLSWLLRGGRRISTKGTQMPDFPPFGALLNTISDAIPTVSVSSKKHKGEDGRIGVIGGSLEYTGAPYYSTITALRCGADLGFVITTPSAATAIKSYSPELMVHPYISNVDVSKSVRDCVALLPRLHSLLIGTGLGRDETNLSIVEKVLLEAKERGLPLVIDADGLYLITKKPELIKGYKKTVLTPNSAEFKSLYRTVLGNDEDTDYASITSVKALAKSLGVTILRKGQTDIISNGDQVLLVQTETSGRRCGGQGDLLSGALTVFLYWLNRSVSQTPPEQLCANMRQYGPFVLASYAATTLTRQCNKQAVQKHGRSTLTTDILQEIHPAFQKLFHID